jgi:mono/diheme cytochrome c family protein
MNLIKPFNLGRRGRIGLAFGTILYMSFILCAPGGDTNAPVAQVPENKMAAVKPSKKAAKKKLTGAELYQVNCNRCHAERYPTEFTSTQWKTVLIHMRVRANIPAAQAREILKYLQEDSGN